MNHNAYNIQKNFSIHCLQAINQKQIVKLEKRDTQTKDTIKWPQTMEQFQNRYP